MERDSSLICVFISFSLNFFNAVSYPPSTRSNCNLSVSFLTKRMSKKLSKKFTQISGVTPYLNKKHKIMKIFKETNLDKVLRLLFPFIDIDECLSGKHGCEGNTTCNNTIGSYCCRCKKGYQGNKTNCTGKYSYLTTGNARVKTKIRAATASRNNLHALMVFILLSQT